MSDRDEPVLDEWERVSWLLANNPRILSPRTARARFLRDAVIALSNPDTPDESVRILRHLTDEIIAALDRLESP